MAKTTNSSPNSALAFTPAFTTPRFTEAEYAVVLDALRIARTTIEENAVGLERVYPSSPLVERLRMDAERMSDLLQSLDA